MCFECLQKANNNKIMIEKKKKKFVSIFYLNILNYSISIFQLTKENGIRKSKKKNCFLKKCSYWRLGNKRK